MHITDKEIELYVTADDSGMRCYGRMLATPMRIEMLKFLKSEIERDTPPVDLMLAFQMFNARMLSMLIVQCTRDDRFDIVCDKIADSFRRFLTTELKHQSKGVRHAVHKNNARQE